ncbi:MAG: hypothetical protein NUW01_04485 [Gemmatimonadaceae bacterium]|nr:hypothetical protein [Gemmatimonadaceae bacterium]
MSTTQETEYIVQIVQDATGKIEYASKPTYRRRAEKIEDGMGINLNWERFSTRIIEAPADA